MVASSEVKVETPNTEKKLEENATPSGDAVSVVPSAEATVVVKSE